MTVEEMIKKSMARMIERKYDISGVEVSSWEEEFDVYSFGEGCSCGPEYEKEYSVTMYYSWENKSKCFTHKGTFSELIRELDENE